MRCSARPSLRNASLEDSGERSPDRRTWSGSKRVLPTARMPGAFGLDDLVRQEPRIRPEWLVGYRQVRNPDAPVWLRDVIVLRASMHGASGRSIALIAARAALTQRVPRLHTANEGLPDTRRRVPARRIEALAGTLTGK